MDIPEEIFRDTKLRDSDGIRLVELLPFEVIPEVRLFKARLSEKPCYVALSCTWSDPKEVSEAVKHSHEIRINGRPARIMDKLYRFLCHNSESNVGPRFWIDVLCLNDAELDPTIQPLPKIYRHASRTLCWLPVYLDTPVSRLLQRFEVMPITSDQRPTGGIFARPPARLFKTHTQHLPTPQNSENGRVSESDPYRSDHKVRPQDFEEQTKILVEEDKEAWRGLNTLVDDGYFSRLWMLQHWVLADKITIRCYSAELDWDKLCTVLETCLFYCPSALLSSPGLLNLISADYLKRQKNHSPDSPASFEDIAIARQNSTFFVTNLRDVLAALTVIWQEFSHRGFRGPVRASEALGLFTLSNSHKTQSFDPESPSWATDWSSTRHAFLLNHRKSSYHASAAEEGKYYDFHGRSVMLCRGIEVDFIRELSQYLPTRRHCDHYNVEGYNTITFGQWFELARKSRQRRGSENLEDQTLRDFADTIQARGCNSIWETPELVGNVVNGMRELLAFLEDEKTAVTSQLRVFYAACFPSHGRKFAITGRGNFCLVPKDATQDDQIYIPHGSRVPFVFRKFDSDFINLGEAYVHGYMNGEAATNVTSTKEQTFRLV